MWHDINTLRLALIVLLGLIAIGFHRGAMMVIIGTLLGAIVRWLAGWPWNAGIIACLAPLLIIPIALRALRLGLGGFTALGLVLGCPAFLLSKITLGSSLFFAVLDGLTIGFLFPLAVLQFMSWIGVIKLKSMPAPKDPQRMGTTRYDPTVFRGGAPVASSSSPISDDRRRW